MASKPKNMLGLAFGKLSVVKESKKRSPGGSVCWECLCECGRLKVINGYLLRKGKTRSCGCLRLGTIRYYKHGMSKTKEYRAWASMKNRCSNQKHKDYKNYGGRGLRVCDKWVNSFESFIKDMGMRPPGRYTIERIDNNKGYSPGNCKWATFKEQLNNTRRNKLISLEGKTKTLSAWCKDLELNYNTIRSRLRMGWSPEKAFEVG